MTLQRRNTWAATRGIYNSFAQPRSSYSDFLLSRPPEPAPPLYNVFTIKDGGFIVKDGAFMTINDCCCDGGIGDLCPVVCEAGTSGINTNEITCTISDLADYIDMYDWSAWSHASHNPADTPNNLQFAPFGTLPPAGWYDGKAFNSWKISSAQVAALNGTYPLTGYVTSDLLHICGWSFSPFFQYNIGGISVYLIRPQTSYRWLWTSGFINQGMYRRQNIDVDTGYPVEIEVVPDFATDNEVWAVAVANVAGRYVFNPLAQPPSCWGYRDLTIFPYDFIYQPVLRWVKIVEADIAENGLPDCRSVFPLTFTRDDAIDYSDNADKLTVRHRDGFSNPDVYVYLPKIVPNLLDATITIDTGI